jgi:hypothetical protein
MDPSRFVARCRDLFASRLLIGLENARLEHVLVVEKTFGEHVDGNQAKSCASFLNRCFVDPKRIRGQHYSGDVSQQPIIGRLPEWFRTDKPGNTKHTKPGTKRSNARWRSDDRRRSDARWLDGENFDA